MVEQASLLRFKTEALGARIDFLRGIFAVWVLVAHTFGLATAGNSNEWLNVWPGIWLDTLLKSGYYGVTGFFFLSGFCIQWSIAKTVARKGADGFSMSSYFKARFLRIAPLFYVGLLVAVVVQWLCCHGLKQPTYAPADAGSISTFFASLGFLQGIFGTYPHYEPSWSITNEMLYYIAWPVILILVGFQMKRAAMLALATALVSTGVFYLLWKKAGDQSWITMTALWCIPLASLMWIAGAVCRIYYDQIVANRLFLMLQRWWWLLLVGWITWTTTLLALKLPFLWRTILDPFVFGIVPLLVLAGWKVPTSRKVTRWLADLSYPLYLLHGIILILVPCLLFTWAPGLSQIPTAILAAIVSLFIAGTVGVKLERIFLRLRSRAIK